MIEPCSIAEKPENLGGPVEMDYEHALERRPRREYHNTIYLYNPVTGQVIGPTGKSITLPLNTSLTDFLEKIESKVTGESKGRKHAVTLYLVASRFIHNRIRDGLREEWFDVYRGWTKKKPLLWDKLYAEYEHNGFTVHLHGTGSFFEETDLDAIYEALNALEKKLEKKFNAVGCRLLGGTPAQTGRESLIISLPEGKKYPRLPQDLLEMINHNFGQARIETFYPKRETLENVWVLDARFMYASCASNLPVGPCYHDYKNEFLGFRKKNGKLSRDAFPGFYNVTVQVPENWNHIGLIKSGKSKTIEESGYYPAIPGEVFTNWTTSSELALALDNGWHVQINERYVWPETNKTTDPLATWKRNLIEMRAEIDQELMEHPSKVLELQRDALRSILLHTIGSFHRFATIETRFTPRDELPLLKNPHRGIAKWKRKNGVLGLEWPEAIPFSSKERQSFIRPEWSAIVWGRARASLNEFTLRLKYESVISLRTDSVWYSDTPPEWIEKEDTKRPGCFRVKEGPEDIDLRYWPDGSELRAYIVNHHLSRGDYNALEKETENDELNRLARTGA